MKSLYIEFFVIFFVLGCSLKAEAAPNDEQTNANADIRKTDGNVAFKIKRVSEALKAKATPTEAQTRANAAIRKADGNSPIKVSEATKSFLIFKQHGIIWKDARAACKMLGGDLAMLHKYEDFDLIASKFQGYPHRNRDYGYYHWLGGYLNGTGPNWKEKFIWNSGEPIPSSFRYWHRGAPYSKSYDCTNLYSYLDSKLVLQNGETKKNGLNAVPCDYVSGMDGYICEV